MANASVQIGMLLVSAIAGFMLFIVVLRFLLQAVRADFYNPICQFVYKASNPILIPVRKFVPGFGGYDMASLVLATLIQIIAISLMCLLVGWPLLPLNILVWAVLGTAGLFLKFYFWGILIMIIASWVAPQSGNPALMLLRQLIEPVMQPIRKLLPDMGGLDLSPIIVFLVIKVLEILLMSFAVETGAPNFIIGL